MYKFIKIRHDIIKQCYGNYKEIKKFNYKLEIDIFRNSSQKHLGVLRGSFDGFGCPVPILNNNPFLFIKSLNTPVPVTVNTTC